MAIGTPWNATNGGQSGLIRVYHIDDKLIWKEMGQGFSGENAGGYFGSVVLSKISMSISEDGIL